MTIAEPSIDLGDRTNGIAAAGAALRPKPLKVEPPEECGGEQVGRWMFWRRMEMQALRERLLSQWTDPATLSDHQIETELDEVEVKLTEAYANGSQAGELEARQWRLRAEQRFRQGRKG